MRHTGAIIFITCLIVSGCAKSVQPTQETRLETQPTAPAQPAETASELPEKMPVLPPPPPAEARDAIKRIYEDAVTVDAGHRSIVGDFNGDYSQDIAVVVKLSAGKLEELNGEVANWILGDPQKTKPPDPKKSVHRFPATQEPIRIEPGDTLLAVVHGYGPMGWRNGEANQTFLLRNAVGADMRMRSAKDVLKGAGKNGSLPMLRGDVIGGRLAGDKGFLYWTGANYAWHP